MVTTELTEEEELALARSTHQRFMQARDPAAVYRIFFEEYADHVDGCPALLSCEHYCICGYEAARNELRKLARERARAEQLFQELKRLPDAPV